MIPTHIVELDSHQVGVQKACTAKVGPIEYELAIPFEPDPLKANFALKKYSIWFSSAKDNLACDPSDCEAGFAAVESSPGKLGQGAAKFRPPKLGLCT